MMNYNEVEDFLFNSFADFQKYGQSALIYDLTNILHLCEQLGKPYLNFKSIHIAGTNGKGSSSHMLASILQEAGYKTGLYTSPHLKSYTERIKINGIDIPREYVTQFVNTHFSLLNSGKYSFFEITTALSFAYFSDNKVDVAVVEVGLGGRLDATNVLKPVVSLITNIGYDHVAILGNTLEQIASEKAGIIKADTPVVVSEFQPECFKVFAHKAHELDADISFASKLFDVEDSKGTIEVWDKLSQQKFEVILDLKGSYQLKNLPGVLQVVKILRENHFKISVNQVLEGLMNVKKNTHLKGRWQILNQKPFIVCDTAHNEAGLVEILSQIQSLQMPTTFLVSFTKEKELGKLIDLFPKHATYNTCTVNNARMRSALEVRKAFASVGIVMNMYEHVNAAIADFKNKASENELLVVLGSNFLIAEIDNL